MRFLQSILSLSACVSAISIGGKHMHVERESEGLQNIVTYDEHSLLIHGERILVFSGEFHPYRLPVPDLWLDVFQKVKALGFNTVSFYSNWALLEGERGTYSAEGVFAFEPFFAAAKEAGIYLIARPGPYINAESSGGGFPGWLQRVKGQLRTRAPDYLSATDLYAASIGKSIADAQITNGGPIILVQPENEYTNSAGQIPGGTFPDPEYFAYVKAQLRNASIVVPFVSNDASAQGYFAPGYVTNGSAQGDVDIYGHDNYPLGFDCANPYTWPIGNIPTNFHALHEKQSLSTFYSLNEFQGGSFDPWGGLGFDQCSILLNMEFERVFYKNDFAAGVALLNIYMIYGGTNWGNSGHSGGYTSYDYGSPITENRELHREKYSELKLEANFLKVSPAYLTASVGNATNGTYTTSKAIYTTPLYGNGTASNFYIIRHSDYQQLTPATYSMLLETSKGTISVPQINGSLTLSGRDSKWVVTDYAMGSVTLLYSTAEIFTWKTFGDKTVLVVYGGPGERHELSVISTSPAQTIEGSGIITKTANETVVINWETSSERRVVRISGLLIYILCRNAAYNYWVPDFVRSDKWGAFAAPIAATQSVIVEAGYFIRGVRMDGSTLQITGDLNATTPLKVIGAPMNSTKLFFNDKQLNFSVDSVTGEWSTTLSYVPPKLVIPDLSTLSWKYLDDLPEIQASYDDSAWTQADHETTNNTVASLQTPTSLYGSDYGFNTGVLVFRGHFTALGNESSFALETQGGSAYGDSVWINSDYVGSWTGEDYAESHKSVYTLPNLVAGTAYVFTVLIDQNGLDENGLVGLDAMKTPRGILSYTLSGRDASAITWKLTGNLGGEAYIDKVRGPLNEGGLFAERQGFTQPEPPSTNWTASSPATGISKAGVALYTTSFDLNLPEGYDVPLSFNFGNTTIGNTTADYRAQLWVNGYQFGKYVNNIGPQKLFPVPQGILNYQGTNWLAIELWAQSCSGAMLTNFTLQRGVVAATSLKKPALVSAPSYSQRPGAY